MTPREEIEQFMRGELTAGGLTKTFGLYAVAWTAGTFEIGWRATDAFTAGQIDVVHGGALAALLDNAMGWATYTVLEDDENFATVDLHVQLLRGARRGVLKARGSVVRRTRALAFCESEVRDEAGELIAKGTAVCAIFRRRA